MIVDIFAMNIFANPKSLETFSKLYNKFIKVHAYILKCLAFICPLLSVQINPIHIHSYVHMIVLGCDVFLKSCKSSPVKINGLIILVHVVPFC